MKLSDIKNLIREEISNFLKTEKVKAPTIQKGTVTDNARLTMILTSLGKRAKGSFQKRKVVSQVIMALAGSLQITPSEVLRAYMDYKKDAKGEASTKIKEK